MPDDAVRSSNRKQDFMMTSLELFYKKGYENTTIKDIIDALGVSKGAFYHYFESKEDVIVAIAKVFSDKVVALIKEIFERTDLSSVEKLNLMFLSVNRYKAKEREWRTKFKTSIESEANLKLQHKMVNFLHQEAVGLFQQLVDAGVREGAFGSPGNSRELGEFLLNTIFTLNKSVYELEKEFYDDAKGADNQRFFSMLDEKVRFYEVMLERVLQLGQGSLNLLTPYTIKFK